MAPSGTVDDEELVPTCTIPVWEGINNSATLQAEK